MANGIHPEENWNDTKFFEDWMNDRCDHPHTVLSVFAILFACSAFVSIIIRFHGRDLNSMEHWERQQP
jgi:hypothetical protein